MYVRSPFIRRNYAELQGQFLQIHAYAHAVHEKAWAGMEADLQEKGASPEARARVREMLLDPSKLEISIRRDATLMSFGMLPEAAEAIYDMQWSIARASGLTFITSDSPVTLGTIIKPPRGMGVGLRSPFALLSFPLSPTVCWLGHWSTRVPPIIRVKRAMVEDYNRQRVYLSERKIFSQPLTHNLPGLARLRERPASNFRVDGFGPEKRAKVKMVRRLKER